MATKQKHTGAGAAAAVGAGMAALGAAAFLIFGPEGKKHRKDLKSWMIKMKAEVMEKMEKAKELSAPVYENIVNDVEKKYQTLKHVDGAELSKEVAELKKNWRALAKTATGKKPAPKMAAKTAKK